MASVVEICNRALQKLGSGQITSLTQNSVEARACNLAYDSTRRALLEDHTWNFAIGREALSADSSQPDWGRTNAFQLPADFLKLITDYPEDLTNCKDWQIEGRKILTDDSAPLYLRYIKDVVDPNQMTPLFREALSSRLAFELSEQLTQSNTKKDALKADYREVISRAKLSNAIQNQAQKPPEDEWVTIRN